MAKKKATDEGLPYFKFFISKWSTGNIQQCGHSSQGLFMNLCVLYWGQRGDLFLSKMYKRFPRKQKHFDELVNEGIIKVISDKIEISFLDEQLQELGYVSEQNRKAAEIRWNGIKVDAPALQTHSERTANGMPKEEIRIEKKREEEIREEVFGAYEITDFKDTPQTAEALNLTDALCNFFAVRPILTAPDYTSVCDYVTCVTHRNELAIAAMALKNYIAYKLQTQEQRHNVNKWIGTYQAHYRDGQWIGTDWEAKLKNIKKNGSINGKPAVTLEQVRAGKGNV